MPESKDFVEDCDCIYMIGRDKDFAQVCSRKKGKLIDVCVYTSYGACAKCSYYISSGAFKRKKHLR